MIDVETIFDSDREEYEFMQENKEQPMKEQIQEIYRPMNEKLFNNLERQYQELAKVKAESEQIEKQAIEEMATKMFIEVNRAGNEISFKNLANSLYNAGYRKQEWISVDERVPNQKESVLVCDEIGDVYTDFIECDGKWSKEISRRWGIKYVYWMPLPEAPKMKGGAE